MIISEFLEYWADGMVRVLVTGSVIILILWLVTRFWSGLSPTIQCWLWRLLFIKLLLLGLWSIPVDLSLLPRSEHQSVIELAPEAVFLESDSSAVGVDSGPVQARSDQPNLFLGFLFMLWVAGLLWGGRSLFMESRVIRRLRANAVEVTPGSKIEGQVREMSQRLGLRHMPRLLFTQEVAGPLVTGFLSPVLILPVGFGTKSSVSAEHLEIVLGHELAHIKRHDLRWLWLTSLTRRLFFFNPLVWLAARSCNASLEQATDELALTRSQVSSGSFATALIELVRPHDLQPGLSSLSVGGSHSFKLLRERILLMKGYTKMSVLKQSLWTVGLLLLSIGLLPSWHLSAESIPLKSLSEESVNNHFGDFDGCFILKNLETGKIFQYGGEQCKRQVSPCSTFKIVLGLAGLETGVLSDATTMYKWDGSTQPFKGWEGDQTLDSAFKKSVNWYFKRILREVGLETMESYVEKLNYGNKTSSHTQEFWFDGSLKISASEQIAFLEQLYLGILPFSEHSHKVVRQILIESSESEDEFGGKTGTCKVDGSLKIGWYVGHIKNGDENMVFATLIEGEEKAKGATAKKITVAILKELGFF